MTGCTVLILRQAPQLMGDTSVAAAAILHQAALFLFFTMVFYPVLLVLRLVTRRSRAAAGVLPAWFAFIGGCWLGSQFELDGPGA